MTDEKTTRPASAGNDNKTPVPNRTLMTDLIMGLRFYSRLPTGAFEHEQPSLSRIALALPFVSIIIGLGPALGLILFASLGLPSLLSAALAIGIWVLVTGAMSEDAIADAVDGLFGGHTPAQRLKILKDSRHGTYGVTALVLYLAIRIFALSAIVETMPLAAAAIWLAAGILSRSGALWLPMKLPPARADGASAAAGQLSKSAFVLGLAFALLLAFIIAAPFSGILSLVGAILLAAALAAGWTWLCHQKIGGQTGDLIGALQAVLEIAALCAFILGLGL